MDGEVIAGTSRELGTILITGVSGQVGCAVKHFLENSAPATVLATPSRAEMDLENPASIRAYVRSVMPRWIVSCAAYTAVDAAEENETVAFAVNATAPGVLAEEAASIGAGLVHLSTDYVFNGGGSNPWMESDPVDPQNVYGRSKLAGELAIAAAGPAHVILRTSWVYSGGGTNFVRTMLRLLSTRTDALRVVADQHGAPTAAADLASAIYRVIDRCEDLALTQTLDGSLRDAIRNVSGVYHCTGTGETTWAGLANAVREYLIDKERMTPPAILSVSSSEYPTPAKRPANSRLDCSKLANVFGIALPPWQNSVSAALADLVERELTPR